MKYQSLFAALLLLPACGDIPRDPDGTLERVQSKNSFRVGLVASGEPVGPERQRLFLRQVARAAGARPVVETGATEQLLLMLESGELDLVIGPMAPKSPWQKRVSFLPPLGEQVDPSGHLHLVAMAKNGENAWIGLLHREASKVAAAR